MKFNPLTDLTLSQRDTAVRQLGGITETEISSLASSLRTASQRTGQIVDVLRRDNKKTNSDLNKIRDLDRRLKRVIPIIPERFGEAGNIYADRQPIPEGGFQFPRIKFPKFPKPGGPIKVPDPGPVNVPEYSPVPDTVDQPDQLPVDPDLFPLPGFPPKPETTPGFPGIPIPGPGIPIPVPILRFAKDFNSGLDKLASTMNDFFEKNPSAMLAMDLSMGGGARSAYGVATQSLFPAGQRALASILIRTNPQLAQRVFRPQGGVVAASPITSTYGRKIGPKPAPVKIPTPPPLRAGQVAPRPSQAQMDDLVRQLEVPQSPQAELARRQAFRDMPSALRGQQETLESMVTPQSSLIPSPPGPIVRPAREIVKKPVGQSGTGIIKKPVDPNKVFGPMKYSASQIDDAIDVLKSAQGRGLAPPGTIGNYMQLNHPEVRKGFLDYLLSAKKGDGTPNYGLYEKILRQIGLLGDAPTQIDDEAFRFILNYHKKVGLDPDLLIKELVNKQLLPNETFLKYSDKISDVIRSSKMSPLNVRPLNVGPTNVPGNQPLLRGGPQSSMIGKPRSMDIASLGIDTSVEIQEIYYIVG